MRKIQLKWAILSVFILTSKLSGFACECGAPAPACAYVSAAPVVFIGTPVYSNDDGSGTFIQQTFYKFTIEEIFKGLPEGTKEIWVDPGSFTSCYAEYKIGTKLLVFASERKFASVDTAAITIANSAGRRKPLPPGFDANVPVYYAPECTGTREVASATDDIKWLRLWKQGDVQARIQGVVRDGLDSLLPGVKITATSHNRDLTASTDASGTFTIEPVQPGKYELSATLSGYDLLSKPQVEVPEHSCGYARFYMAASGALSGRVVDQSGRPAAGIELNLARMQGSEMIFPSIHPETTKVGGFFRYAELPEGDYLIGVNLRSQPDVDTPYAPTYAPGVPSREGAQVFHLGRGQQLSHIRIQLPPRLRLRTIHVEVHWPDGRSAGPLAWVGSEADFQQTKVDGSASIRCFAASDCTVKASRWLTRRGESATPKCALSSPKHVKAGNTPVSFSLILTETKSSCDDE